MAYDLSQTNAQVSAALSRSLNAAKSVLDYDVDNTGASDCTAEFVTAIAASEGKNLYVPKGTYLLSETGVTGACLQIAHSIALVCDPEAVFKLDVNADVPLIMIGDNSTAFSKVTIVGGQLDGDASNSNITPIVRTSLIEVRGPVTDVLVADMSIGNAVLGAVEVSGTDTSNRAKRINFERCPVDNVTEGVVIQFCDGFNWRGGDISNMTLQDCFEPHGGIDGWSLRDCTISAADSTNSEIEIYPQVGDILHGVVENVRIKGEMRISLSSAATYEVNGVAITNCVFENGLIYTGVGDGRHRGVVVDGCEFIGPASNVPRSVPTTYKGAIHANGATNRIDVLNCRVYDYEGSGIAVACDEAKIAGNVVYNNGQEATLAGYLRCGIFATGDNVLCMGNRAYDDQVTKTQIYTPQIRGDNCRIIGNHFTNATTLTRTLGAGWVSYGNIGDIQDHVDAYVTMPASATYVDLDQSLLPGLSFSGDAIFDLRLQLTPVDNMTPAVRCWLTDGAGNVRVNVDAAVTSDTRFRIVSIVHAAQIDVTL